MFRTWKPTLLYALAHFAVDLGCAYAMFAGHNGSPIGFLLYNFCAFAMQMPMGLLADASNHNRSFALLGTAMVAAVCCFPAFGAMGCILLGLGNGLFHIGGGLDVLNLSEDRAAPLGVFVSPGAYGVFLGTLWGSKAGSPIPILAAVVLALAGMWLIRPKTIPANTAVAFPDRKVSIPAFFLFLVVILRSYGGMSGTFSWKTELWSFIAVTAVVLGKTAGGFLADRVGLFRAAAGSLILAATLFCFGDSPLPGVLALFLFNMTMPITLFALAQAMPGCKGFSFGLLTFALFLGFLPTYFGTPAIDGTGMAIVCLISLIFLLFALNKLPSSNHPK